MKPFKNLIISQAVKSQHIVKFRSLHLTWRVGPRMLVGLENTREDGKVQTREYICPQKLLHFGEDYEASTNF